MDFDQKKINQKLLCSKYNTDYFETPETLKIGISESALNGGILPLNGLRIKPEGDTSGWYIWAGEELSKEDDFFKPIHISHLDHYLPEIVKFLALPPGWRFLIADDYVDVWLDLELA
jgi:hypothetical protein